MKKLLAMALTLCLLLGMIPAVSAADYPGAHTIVLASAETGGGYTHSATLDGAAVEEFDYVWHADPGTPHDEVKNAPAEYFTGDRPDTTAAAYIAHDVCYFPELPADGFKRVNYDGEQEWVYYYTAEEWSDYIFANLPISGNTVPASMMHSEEEAYENAVLHITQAGTYILEGEWHGQIWIDLGDPDDTFTDESARVTVILNGVDVTCTVAPALVFYSVYECDNTWEDQDSWSYDVDTSNAGANVIIADGTVNNFTGENVYRMLKTTYKSGQEGKAVPVQKKMRKLDGAFYSYVSMNIDGEEKDTGVLNITAGYEGLDTELHLTVNGGNINIFSQDDGMNVNEDGVSVITFNGGSTHIVAGLGREGDGIDSNGYLVVNGGTVITLANPNSDSGMDSDSGTYVKGGTVVALGSTMDWASDYGGQASGQAVMNLQFAAAQSADEAIIVTDTDGKIAFAYDPDKDEVAGSNARWYRGAIISAPGIQTGGSYYVYVGGDVYGSETQGLYDVSTVTGFSDQARQQCYTGTGGLGGFGGMGGGRFPGGEGVKGGGRSTIPGTGGPGSTWFEIIKVWPEIVDYLPDLIRLWPDMGATLPDIINLWPDMDSFLANKEWLMEAIINGNILSPDKWGGSSDHPQDGGQTRPDDGWNGEGFGPGGGTTPPDMPDGERPQGGPGGGNQGGGTAPGGGAAPGGGNITFTMTSKVNSFSGVADYIGDAPGVTFTDVPDWCSTAVDWAVDKGVTNGTGDGKFSPNDTCKNVEILTMLWRAAGKPAAKAASPFTVASWYQDAVDWAYGEGLIDDDAIPDAHCTRASALSYIWQVFGSPSAEGGSFTDVSADADYAAAVIWGVANGVTNGYGDTFRPGNTCTRAEIVTFLHRAYVPAVRLNA